MSSSKLSSKSTSSSGGGGGGGSGNEMPGGRGGEAYLVTYLESSRPRP